MEHSQSGDEQPTVLVVDDEPTMADIYTDQLAKTYTVHTAYSGEEALEIVDSEIDVVLLDRRMSGLSGDDVLEEIRAREIDCRIIMVTAVIPDLDIIDLPFDEYLVKPVSGELLHDSIEQMLVRTTYHTNIREFVALASKMATLESKMDLSELKASDEYAGLEARFFDLREELNGDVPKEDLYTEFITEKIQSLVG